MTIPGPRPRPSTIVLVGLCLCVGLGWTWRERAWAGRLANAVGSATINVDQVKMEVFKDKGLPVGQIGVYIRGDTPASSSFVTGRFVIDPGKSPHAPHVHAEEEVMIVEKGHGEIVCDGKTTTVGPGSVMYATPSTPHGINNTGAEPLTFYYVKWAPKESPR